MESTKPVALNEKVPFRCKLCGGCCRYVANSIMLEPMDAYRLARHLRDQGVPVTGIEDVLAQYSHAAWLADSLPIFLLNTVGSLDVCVFLKAGRCSVYEARPRICRLYPFTVAPGSRGREFQYLICTEKPHHFEDGIVTLKDWLSQNFPKEARQFLKADYDTLSALGRNIRTMGETRFKGILFQFLFYRYYNYDLEKPFLPQFISNTEELKKLTAEVAKEG